MRILYLTSAGNASGGARQALNLASGMKERGHEVMFFTPPGSGLRALAPGMDWRDLPEKRRHWRKALEEALRGQAAVVHAFHNQAVKTLAFCGTLWRLCGRPVACVAHRGVIYPPKNFLPYIAPGIRVFAVNSRACLDTLPLFWRKKAGRVVYNCVPQSKITPGRTLDAVRTELDIDAGATVIGYVGNDAPVKGVEYLIRAFAKIARPGLILCLVGNGRRNVWRPLCAELGITGAARLVPRTERVADYLQLFTLFVLPSLSESSPSTLLEAMCMGLPAVCSKVGGVPECIDDSRFLVPPGDADALAAAVASALSDREALAGAARRNLAFSARFSMERKLDVMEGIYADLLGTY